MKAPCLSEAQLRAVLAGTAPNDLLSSAEQHLGTCRLCQNTLEFLAGTGSGEDFRTLRPAPLDQSAGELDRVVREAKRSSQSSLAEMDGSVESAFILQYLSASQDPRNLGRLGNYEIQQIIASGGMGIVLKALETSLNRVVAIKILAPVLAADEKAKQRFLREARAVAAIRHENVIGIFAVGEENGLPFIAMEFIEGLSIAEKINGEGPLPIEKLLPIARQIIAGLAAAHARGIIHRDIKPGNILIEHTTERVKITDFGLARTLDDTALTRTGFITGTPEYLSPEQAAGESGDSRSDLFSLGSLLYAAAIGTSPFHASTTLGVLRRVSDHHPVPLEEINPGIPPAFSRFVERLMAKNPLERIQSAVECAAALAAIERGDTPLGSSGARPRSRRKNLLVLSMAGAAVFALLLFVSISDFSQTPPLFAAYDAAGKRTGVFKQLANALEATPDAGTIEFRWNGELDLPPVDLPAKSLTIRAATHARPIWVHRDSNRAALFSRGDLRLEGVEFHYGAASNAPPTRDKRGPRPPPGERPAPFSVPGQGALVAARANHLTFNGCVFQHNRGPAEDFTAILLEGARECTILNSAIHFPEGKAIVLAPPSAGRSEGTTLVVSNCVIKGRQSFWIAEPPGTKVDFRLVQSSFKGESLLFVPDGGSAHLNIDLRRNLIAPGVLIIDQRPFEAEPLFRTMNWTDTENLYGVDRLIVSARTMQNGGPRSIFNLPFAQRISESSFEGKVLFRPNANGNEEFRPTDITVFGASQIQREKWALFGAKLETAGLPPAAEPSSH